ncbi:MAG: FlaD/FlaE family flagellar protein [Thermoplasmatota archaeon]
MARAEGDQEELDFVLDEDEEEVEVSSSSRSKVKGGGVERYEVRIGPPLVSGRKVKPVRTPEEKKEKEKETGTPRSPQGGPGYSSQSPSSTSSMSGASSQQMFKIEDDLRRTRDVVEDLKHNMSIMEGEVKDLKAEMGRMSYLLRSLEGLKNTMTDMESTVSELSGLYDLISANINPFVEIPPLRSRNKVIKPEGEGEVGSGKESDEADFQELSDIFEDEEEQEEIDEWGSPDLESEGWTLRWTKFLIEKVGKDGLERALDYYKDLGWIDEDIAEKILEISRGTKGKKIRSDGKKRSWRMDAEDHVKSLEFIKRMNELRR